MQIASPFSRRVNIALAVLVAGLGVGWLFAYEPVTRNLIARDGLCTLCHIDKEYVPTLLVSRAEPHPRTPQGDQARCVDCHLPKGFWATTAAYAHFVSLTDLFWHFRDRDRERAGDWIPPRAATAHRVRERLFEYDSVTCRGCHEEAAIRPASSRGKMAHRQARWQRRTCIECHYNMAHRQVELQAGAFSGPRPELPDAVLPIVTAPSFDVTQVDENPSAGKSVR